MHGDGLVEIVDRDDVEQGGEGLLLQNGSVFVDLHDRRLGIGFPQPRKAVPPVENFPALFLSHVEGGHHVLHRRRVDQRPHQSGPIESVTDGDLTVCVYQACRNLVHHGPVHDQAPQRGAALAGRADGGKEGRPNCQIEVGIIHHDDRVVAAEFEDRAAESLRNPCSHLVSHVARTGC